MYGSALRCKKPGRRSTRGKSITGASPPNRRASAVCTEFGIFERAILDQPVAVVPPWACLNDAVGIKPRLQYGGQRCAVEVNENCPDANNVLRLPSLAVRSVHAEEYSGSASSSARRANQEHHCSD